ncbi:uncharacterized protein LOC127791027 [Diospyros lotus]|uniref:uncharacterized protein LOC127791027 n=1 Tax=Diospyros lotus TaxID=55363 RepID=UPI00225343C4|nr:uncharacterized protein LOC127791027 [Diospyros lotus]
MVWKDIICRFSVPRILNTDHGTQFDSDAFRAFCHRWGINLRMASVAYPQANEQAEASNKTILHGLKTRLEKVKGGWADELPSILWAYRTTSRVPTGETPFSLAYGIDTLIPVEVDLGSPRVMAFREEGNSDRLRENVDLLNELREKADNWQLIREESPTTTMRGFALANLKTEIWYSGRQPSPMLLERNGNSDLIGKDLTEFEKCWDLTCAYCRRYKARQ